MSGIERESKHTPVTAQQVYDLFTFYLEKYIGRNEVSHKGVMLLLAQVVLESGHFKYVRNFNLGGIKTTRSWNGDWQHFTTTEYFRKSLAERYLNNPDPNGRVDLVNIDKNGVYQLRISGRHSLNKFVSFNTLEEYCDHHVKLLTGPYKPAVNLAMLGDVRGFCYGLREIGYYTDSAEKYFFNVNSLVKTYEKIVIRDESLPLVLSKTPETPKSLPLEHPFETPLPVTIQDSPRMNNDMVINTITDSKADSVKPGQNTEQQVLPQIGKKLDLKPIPWWYSIINFIIKLFTRRVNNLMK